MSTPLIVLILEDSAEDAELMVHELRQAGFAPQWTRVETEADYVAHLDGELDLILADYSLPSFDAARALEYVKRRELDVPFLIVSGCIGEEGAVECMKRGATDYLLKDRLARLGQAVRNALDGKRVRDDRRIVEEQLLHDAFHDTLTGLPNRSLFIDRVERCLSQIGRRSGYVFAVLLLDLDGFQRINASIGQNDADKLLIQVSERLVGCIRSCDTLARVGGDEFGCLLDDIRDVSNAMRVAQRFQHVLAKPFTIGDREVFVTASIGISSSITGYKRAEDAMRDAGTATARAKKLGPSERAVFDMRMHTQAVARLTLETDLRRAAERQEFRLYYQPVISLATGRIASFEALLRWQHPQHGLIGPSECLPVAEEMGLLVPVGQWVLSTACRQMRSWQSGAPEYLAMSVNLSCKQFFQSDLVPLVEEALQETGVQPHRLTLEITETIIMDNAELAIATLNQLRERKIRISMDDFGTGYSSLSYLQRFPFDVLKIDQSFIRNITGATESLEIVRSIVALGHNLGKQVIAEGVESADQLKVLRALGCDYGQGHWFSKPLESNAAKALIDAKRIW